MSTERETTRIVRSWLEDGVTALPDRVLDVVLDQLPATPQRRPFWRARRFPTMNSPVRYAIAAAAVLVVALVGYQLLPSNVGSGGESPTPSPTVGAQATASPAVSLAAIPELPSEGDVAPGEYYLVESDFIVEVPAGWATCCNGIITKNDFAAIIYGDLTGFAVPADSCHWRSGERSEPNDAAEFAAAYAAQVPRNATAPRDVTVAGLPAVHVRVTVPDDQEKDSSGFVGCDDGEFVSDLDPQGERARYHQGPGQVDDIYLLDMDGGTYAFNVVTGPDTTASDRADLEAMFESLRLAEGGSS